MIRAINPGLFKSKSLKSKKNIQTRIDNSNAALKLELERPAIQLEYLGLNNPNSQSQKPDSKPKGPTLEAPDSDDEAIKEKTPVKKFYKGTDINNIPIEEIPNIGKFMKGNLIEYPSPEKIFEKFLNLAQKKNIPLFCRALF